jgi:hypothetical protein
MKITFEVYKMKNTTLKIVQVVVAITIMLMAVTAVQAAEYEQVGDLRIAAPYYFTNNEGYQLLDFEDANLELGTQYEDSHGIKFEGKDSKTIRHNTYNRGDQPTASGEYSIGNSATFPETSAGTPFKILIKEGAESVGFYMGNGNDEIAARITAFNKEGEVLGIIRESNFGDPVTTFVGFASVGDPVSKVEIDYGDTLLSEAIDNLMWIPAQMGESPDATSCTDSDESGDLYTKGTVRNALGGRGGPVLGPQQDYCTDNGQVAEVSCGTGGVITRTYYGCPVGTMCNQGACVEENLVHLPDYSCSSTNTLQEGEFKYYGIDDLTYAVAVNYISDAPRNPTADMSISYWHQPGNLERTGFLLKTFELGESKFVGEIQFTVDRIDQLENSIEFCFDGMEAEEVHPEVALTPEQVPQISCGDSHGGDGYYKMCEGNTLNHNNNIEFKVDDLDQDELEIVVSTAGLNEKFSLSLKEFVKFHHQGYEYKVQFNHYEQSSQKATIYVAHTVLPDGHPMRGKIIVVEQEPVRESARVVSPDIMCGGCEGGNNCIPYGTRFLENKEPVYCEISGDFHDQKQVGDTCQNNYECLSNQCSNGHCIDLSGDIKEAQNVLERIFNWLKERFRL